MKKYFLFAAILIAAALSGQTSDFGQNKVQYTNQNWKVTKTKHFDIYFYQGGEEIASFASQVAESSITELENEFNYALKKRVPVLIYNSHKDFEETNVTYDILSEFVGGFTESIKSRVVIPFEGSYSSFRHVINHELVHAMQFDFLYGGSSTSAILNNIVYDIPLWFTEGSAEFYSRFWDKETDMYMRDALVNDTIIDLETLGYYSGGYIIYKEGESALKYIYDTYGSEKIVDLYIDMKSTKSFYKSLINVLGIDIVQLDRDWRYSLKKRYYPLIEDRELKPKNGESILGDFFLTSSYNVTPSLSPDGNNVAFISEKYGYFDLYLLSLYKPEKKVKIMPRSFTRHFESFHLQHGAINWSKDSEWLLFTARLNNMESVYIYDVKKRKKAHQIKLKADAIFSPCVSPSKEKVAYVSQRDGRTDICVYDLKTKKEKHATDDIYDDASPAFIDDSTLLFVSSRPDSGGVWNYTSTRLFFINLKSGEMRVLEGDYGKGIEKFSLVNDSTIIYSSYSDDISNVYLLNLNSTDIRRMTNVMTGVFSPSMSSDMSVMTFQIFSDMGYDIMSVRNPLAGDYEYSVKNYSDYADKFVDVSISPASGKKPPFNFSVDWAAGAFTYTPGIGVLGLLDIGISDMMGDNRIYIQVEKLSFNGNGYAALQYWWMRNRVDIAAMLINQQYEYILSSYSTRTETYNGGGVLFRMPFDRYNRADITATLYKFNETYNVYTTDSIWRFPIHSSYISQSIISLVHDNGIWGYLGPVNGDMARVDFGAAFEIPNDESFRMSYIYSYLSADMRKYFILTTRSQIAARIGMTSIFSDDKYYEYLGGTRNLRGYSDYEFAASNVAFANFELRFPLIDRIKFPIYELSLNNIRGVFFTDMGFARDDLSKMRLINDQYILDDLKMGFGAGIRMDIWITILKLDIAKHTDLQYISPETYYHLSFGAEF